MITVKLVGGLGNQLFGYYFGQAIEKRVRYDISDQILGLGSQNVSIVDIDLPGDFGVFTNRISTLLPDRLKIFKRLLRKLSLLNQKFWNSSRLYESNTVGYDINFNLEDCDFKQIRGYFQSYKYVDVAIALNPHLQYLKLKSYSKWFQELREQMNLIEPTVIHVRRGDYSNLRETFGILSEEYYLRAVEEINASTDSTSPIWIFSDSPQEISESMPNLMNLGPKIISAPQGVSDAETLILMSNASRIVISNSTFSWWAARINGTDKTVIAPKKWFKGLPDPEFLIPANWVRSNSFWLD